MRLVFIFLLMLMPVLLLAQSSIISGHIYDSETGERLFGASIYNASSQKGSVSNEHGFYSLTLPKRDTTVLTISFLGYESARKTVFTNENLKLDVFLSAQGFLLDEVELKASREIPIEKRNEIGVITLRSKQIEALPALGGEVDVLKALQLMPGVQSGDEGSSGLYVRGGSNDQNLVLLDDVPLYYVNHLGGLVSTFNIDAINSVKLIKGGFPARYGGRLSSVLDVRMNDGNMKKFQGNGMLGMVAAKLTLQGPIKKDTTSYLISVRRMMYDLLTRPLSKAAFDGVALGYTFHDINAKLNHRFSQKDHLYLSAYFGNDRSIVLKNGDENFKNSMSWGNNLASLRWNHVFGPKLFGNLTMYHTRYRFLTGLESNFSSNGETFSIGQEFLSGIFDTAAKLDFDYYASPNISFKFGYNSIYHTFKPGATNNVQAQNGREQLNVTIGNEPIFAWENAGYFESEFRIGDKITTNLGFRTSVYHVEGQDYVSYEPRAVLTYLMAGETALKASYSKMQQNVHLLTNSGLGLPTDLWVPATGTIAPQRSGLYTLGVVKSLKNGIYELSLEGYHKQMQNLIEYKEGAVFLGSTSNWEALVESNGQGTSYGAELLLQKKEGKTTGWLGYTWSKTTRQFDGINGGREFPYRYDRRNDASIVIVHQWKKNIDVSASWVYGTGAAFTLPLARYDTGETPDVDSEIPERFSEVFIYGDRNANRMRAYHRLDVGINLRKKKKWGERTLNISVYNLYARQNPYFYFIDTEVTFDQNAQVISERNVLKQQSLFPILPSIGYGFRF